MAILTARSDVEQAREGEEELDNFPASIRDDSSWKADHGNLSAKSSSQQPYLHVPLQSAFARSSATFSERSTYSADNENERRTGRLLTPSSRGRLLSRSPAPSPRTWREAFRPFWAKNKGLSLVIFAQLFGVVMNVTNKLLETSGTSGPGMHPFQVLQAVHPDIPIGHARRNSYIDRSYLLGWPGPSFSAASTNGGLKSTEHPLVRGSSVDYCLHVGSVDLLQVSQGYILHNARRLLTNSTVYGLYCKHGSHQPPFQIHRLTV